MRMADRNPMEKAALLEWLNEDFGEGVRQPCCRCVVVAIKQQAESPHLLLGQLFREMGDPIMGGEKFVMRLFTATRSTSVRASRSGHTCKQFFKKTHGGDQKSLLAAVCLVENPAQHF